MESSRYRIGHFPPRPRLGAWHRLLIWWANR